MNDELDILVVEDSNVGTLVVVGDDEVLVVSEGQQGPPGIGIKGDKGDPGDTMVGTDLHYDHTQFQAAAQWVVNHGLGKYPSVTVFDSAGEEVEGDYKYPDTNTVILTFAYPFAGTASFN